ncbi:beta-1,4-glucuronyltransferase 1-like [Agrilus planipennis]|uniref:Beta-1,4-glucuronyltransferase 1-like n=1 Tax=Agrilus planipennis TaxID=224129 RepID=A0A1W4WP15_AGRPL|nr:beta-1,4-glucuronyltransferase 1-like [Agrilus planipennis]
MRRRYFVLLIGSTSAILFLLTTVNQNGKNYDGESRSSISVSEKIEVYSSIDNLIDCSDKKLDFFIEQRGEFFIFYNYVVAKRQFRCHEAVTYTTQGDVTFLDNLIPLVERWNGPISVSIYSPGDDFKLVIDSVAYLRNCGKSSIKIKELVSFHLFFEAKFTTKVFNESLANNTKIYKDEVNCSKNPPYSTVKHKDLFKTKNNLLYPINLARNSARTAAQTYFVLASDMELYPTPNFSSKFIEMVSKNEQLVTGKQRQVFVLPIFEVTKDSSIPENKTVLKGMINTKQAFIFHEKLCRYCHIVPGYNEWIKDNGSSDLNVFTIAKRNKKYRFWEPFFVGTNKDPLFDERLTWEGQSNKMTQNYIQCVLDYDYLILNNAFLVHRPGIKKAKEQLKQFIGQIIKTNKFLKNEIKHELTLLYGNRTGCEL